MGVARNIALWLILLGYAMLGAVGARTNMALQWPSYILFGVAALVAIVLIWNRTRLTPSRWCLISTGTLTLYVVVRAAASPVVPLPANASSTRSPSLVCTSTIRRRTPSGFCVG